jgi:hypothetical protein
MVLEAYNLWTIVKGDEPKPTTVASIPDWEKMGNEGESVVANVCKGQHNSSYKRL